MTKFNTFILVGTKSVAVGNEGSFLATLHPDQINCVAQCVWSSSNPAIASIETALNLDGTPLDPGTRFVQVLANAPGTCTIGASLKSDSPLRDVCSPGHEPSVGVTLTVTA